jgi:four helix bundle protein
MTETKHRSFEDLNVWKEARKLRQEIYLLTKQLPVEEKYVLVPQMRRAALSVTNNIAEGHGRFHYQENIQFLRLSRGSLEEVLDDLTLCEDQGYVDPTQAQALRQQTVRVEQLLNGYIRYLSGQTAGSVREGPADYLTSHESPITSHDI